MTDHESTGPESMGSYSLGDEDQLQPEDTLDDRGVDDLLDEGYSPPERPRGVDAFGTTVAEQQQGESIEAGLAHEVPDPANAFEDPLAEADMVGGDIGIDGGGSSAEEAAVHIIEDEQRWDRD